MYAGDIPTGGTSAHGKSVETLLHGQGRALEVVNEAGNETEDLLADLMSIIYSFCARLYGQRRAKRKTEVIVKQLEAGEGTDAIG